MKKIFIFTILGFLTVSANTFAAPGHDISGRKPGDIISPLTDDQIAAWCDFNKQIVITRTNVLCAYNGFK